MFTKQKEAFEKLDVLLKNLKDRDSTLFQTNGINLKKGEEFQHDFNVKHIANIEEKQKKVSQETDALSDGKKTFERIFKGLRGTYTSKKRKINEHRRKSKENDLKTTSGVFIISALLIPWPESFPVVFFTPLP